MSALSAQITLQSIVDAKQTIIVRGLEEDMNAAWQ